MRNRTVYNTLSINTVAKIMEVFSAAWGWGSRKRGKKNRKTNKLIRHAKGPELVLSTLAVLADTESLEQKPDSPVAASLQTKVEKVTG